MNYDVIQHDGYYTTAAGIDAAGRKIELGMADPRFIQTEGCVFKDMTGDGVLYPYEDWRLDAKERAKDLSRRLSVEEIAGLMLFSSHQSVPFDKPGPFKGHYGGKLYDAAVRDGVCPSDLSDEQREFLARDHVRHVLLTSFKDPETAARWTNKLQAAAEAEHFGIPVNISSDPRHGAGMTSAEFRGTENGVSVWPEGIGLTALHDIDTVKQFAKTAAIEYRAMGITTALWPQIDLATEPRWMRLEDTPGGDVQTNIAMARALCDGLQTTEGSPDGWGRDSVAAMAKHWPGGGPVEGGRDAHYPFGAYAVYPGNNFDSHVRVFTEGALRLDGPTGQAAAIMPYYTVCWDVDVKNHENVANNYSEYIIGDLLRGRYGYDGVICSDWDITKDPVGTMDSFGSRCYGVENLTEAERHLRILMNGVDQFGGNNESEPVIEAYRIGCERYGEDRMRARFEESAARILTVMFRLGLFENPYVDPERAKRIVGCTEFRTAGRMAEERSVVLLKNRARGPEIGDADQNGGKVLPLRPGAKIWCPERTIRARRNFIRQMDEECHIRPMTGSFVTDDPEEADAAVVFIESPLSNNGYLDRDAAAGGNGYLPIPLQYRSYIADTAREHSIAGGDFRENFVDRSYRGKRETAANERDLDNVMEARRLMGNKPVIVCITMHNPTVPKEFEPFADAILVNFRVEDCILLDILYGRRKAWGRLPYRLPADMETIERHCEDCFDDYEPYEDSEGNVYETGFGLES